METHAFSNQVYTNQEKKTERQYLHGRMPINEPTDWLGKNHHDRDRQNHGDNHHSDLVYHSHGGDYRVERKNSIEQSDLKQNRRERGANRSGAVFVAAFNSVMNFACALGQ